MIVARSPRCYRLCGATLSLPQCCREVLTATAACLMMLHENEFLQSTLVMYHRAVGCLWSRDYGVPPQTQK